MILTAGKNPILPTKGGDENSAFIFAELIMKGSILCQRCGSSRKERGCPKCGCDSCAIRISINGKYARIYHDKKGAALSYTEAFRSLSTINGEIESEKKAGQNST
jgi:hypothetical protein